MNRPGNIRNLNSFWFGELEQKRVAPINWLPAPTRVAKTMIQKYGPANEVTDKRMIWHHNGPWKRSMLENVEIPHQFPGPHVDCLIQTINYRVPPAFHTALSLFDGSVYFDRTRGELSARCDAEGANFLAINLAVEILHGKKTIAEARKHYAETSRGQHKHYKKKFLFRLPTKATNDPDIGYYQH